MARPSQARLDLAAARANLALARELAPAARVMAVVKANAYGHGAVTMARTFAGAADALAVACLEEALELRESGLEAPILLLEGVFEPAELALAAAAECWVTIDNEQQLSWLEQAALSDPLRCWLKIDTGMHRLGVAPDRAEEFHQRLQATPNCAGTPVISTHFARADELECTATTAQLKQFETTCQSLPGLRSAANSPGLLGWPASHYDWVRPGYMLYGNSPFGAVSPPAAARLRPVMTLVSGVISVRDVAAGDAVGYGGSWTARRPSRIATITIGYGDGYPRTAVNGTPVLINGHRATLAGRVSMDMITVDVTALPPVAIGDEAVLWGQGLPLAEVAVAAGTIGYELTTRMPARTARIVTTP